MAAEALPASEPRRKSRFEGWTQADYDQNRHLIEDRGPQPKRNTIDPLAEAAAEMAPLFVETLIHHWPDPLPTYEALRFLVVEVVYDELARERGMQGQPIETVVECSAAVIALRAHVKQLPLPHMTPEHFGCVHEALCGFHIEDRKVVPNGGRRKGGIHFTPRWFASKVATRAIVPLWKTFQHEGHSPLSMRVVDPAVGAGAFLLATIRYLAPWVLKRGEAQSLDQAKQLVARHVCRGLDIDRFAAHAARLAVMLECRADGAPVGWLDGTIRHGDALLGLSLEQIRRFHWLPKGECVPAAKCVERYVTLRKELFGSRAAPTTRLEYIHAKCDVTLLADVCLGAFFSSASIKERERERQRRGAIVDCWWAAMESASKDLLLVQRDMEAMQAALRERYTPFHWDVEYLDEIGEERGENSYAHVFTGNPPFLGGKSVSGTLGEAYRDWLQVLHDGAHGNADLSAHFFRRAYTLLGECGGTVGFISTNTICQGDTRETGLQWLLDHGMRIYDANKSMPWPGAAKVSVATVHLTKAAA
jgi:hypothetical protein